MIGGDCDCLSDKHEYRNGSVGFQFQSIDNLIRTDRKKYSWIDKSFVSLLRGNTTDRE